MKYFLYFAFCSLACNSYAQAQDAKLHLRDFTPKDQIDTSGVRVAMANLKRPVIALLEVEGIKSAFWDEEAKLMTVQYNNKQIALSVLKEMLSDKPGKCPVCGMSLIETTKIKMETRKTS